MSPPGDRSPPRRTSTSVAESPHHRSAEDSLLGSILLDEACLPEVRRQVESSDFYVVANKKLYETVCDLNDHGLPFNDLTVLGNELIARNLLESIGGAPYLTHLMECVPSAAHVDHYVAIVREKAQRRDLQSMATSLAQGAVGSSPVPQVIAEATESLDRTVHRMQGTLAAADESALDLIDAEIPQPRCVLGNGLLVAATFALLAGRPGFGKTWLVLQLAIAIAKGTLWLGLKTTRGRVGVISLELHRHTLQQRLRVLLGEEREGLEGIRLIARGKQLDLLDGRTEHELVDWIHKHRLDVVIIDPLSRCHTADENDAQEMGQVLRCIERICEKTNCCILLVHHERKGLPGSNGHDDLDAVRGSSRLLSDPSLVLRLKSEKGLLRLVAAKSNHGSMEPVWLKKDADGVPRPCETPPSASEQGDENEQAVHHALDEGPRARREIEKVTGLAKSAVGKHLRTLMDAGKVRDLPGHRYEQVAQP